MDRPTENGHCISVVGPFIVPFCLAWLGFVLFWQHNMLKLNGGFPSFFGIPFICIGLYVLVGRFFGDALRRKNTTYAITDNRVIIKSGIFSKTIKSLNIKTISDLTVREKTDGTGTISLGPTVYGNALFDNGSFSTMSNQRGARLPPRLELIDEVGRVYNILVQQQRGS